jgi:hypothetical protein
MASIMVGHARAPRTGDLLRSCLAEHGSAAHPYPSSGALGRGLEAARDLADAISFLCALHGRLPGVIDHAAATDGPRDGGEWLRGCAEAARLAVAAGPAPGTPGGAAAEALAIAQRHALATLARSERRGCPTGAALALAIDWNYVRTLLDHAAEWLGVERTPCLIEDSEALIALADRLPDSPGFERAMLFGAQQMLLQHRGLWDLLEARRQARASR